MRFHRVMPVGLRVACAWVWLALSVTFAAGASGNELELSSVTVASTPGTVDVDVSLDVDTDLSSFGFRVTYDSALLSISANDIAEAPARFPSRRNAATTVTVRDSGQLVWSAHNLLGEAALLAGDGTILTLTFTVSGDLQGATTALTLDNVSAMDAFLDDVSVETITDGAVQQAALTLGLTVDEASITETAGSATGTVTRSGFPTGDLTVQLATAEAGQLTVPAQVVIPDGSASAEFAIDATDDNAWDGDVAVTVTASAQGFTDAQAGITVLDNEDYTDDDDDGMPTAWEDLYGLASGDPDDADLDLDGDGIRNLDEFEAGSDPSKYVITVDAGWNLISIARRPEDNSAAALFSTISGHTVWGWDGTQYYRASRIESLQAYWVYSDTGGEVEVDMTWSVLPGASAGDADGDGMNDAWEDAHGLNSADSNDAHLDLDGDGASNRQEFDDGTDPEAYELDLTVQWNAVSIARQPAKNTVRAVLGNRTAPPGWLWEYRDSAYVKPTEISPLRGYWLRTDEAKTLRFGADGTVTE